MTAGCEVGYKKHEEGTEAHGQIPTTRPPTPLMRRLGLLAGVLVVALAVAAPAGAASNGWTVVPSAAGVAPLTGVSCPTFYSCMAVGGQAGGGPGARAESWNGRAWSIVPPAVLPPEISVLGLYGVSCVSDRFCAAVGVKTFSECRGSSCDRGLSETWNGKEWSVAPEGAGGIEFPQDVSCVTSRFCVGVGVNGAISEKQRIQSWNGTEWSSVSTPKPEVPCTALCFGKETKLGGVSCVSTTFCVAVGWDAFLHSDFHTLVESWNGEEWSVVPSPDVSGPNGARTFTELKDVSCVSANRCVAVGQVGFSTLVESWDGKEWSILESPNPEGSKESKLNGVSCVRWGSCAAVGTYNTASGHQALVETSKGTKWSLVPSANGAGAESELDRVSCAPVLFLWQTCMAVGSTDNPEEPGQNIVENSGIF